MGETTANLQSLQMKIEIDAAREDVWQALIDNIGEWWPAEFYTGGDAERRTFKLEARPGGRMFEEWGDGGGTLWGQVIAVDPGKKLQVLGQVFPDWGGPSQNYETWILEGDGKRTALTFSETSMGRVSTAGMEEKDKGWTFLWNTLKAHVEGSPLPAWQD